MRAGGRFITLLKEKDRFLGMDVVWWIRWVVVWWIRWVVEQFFGVVDVVDQVGWEIMISVSGHLHRLVRRGLVFAVRVDGDVPERRSSIRSVGD